MYAGFRFFGFAKCTFGTVLMPQPGRVNWGRWGLIVGVVFLVAGMVVWWRNRPPDPKLLDEARTALEQGRSTDTLRLANTYLQKAPHSAAALLYAALAEQRLEQPDRALSYLQEIPSEDASEEALDAALLAGRLYMAKGFVRDAEQSFRRVLQHRPNNLDANRQMMFLLSEEGRRWESRPYLLQLVSQQVNTVEELILLGDLWIHFELRAELDRFRQSRPRDPLPLLGLARMDVRQQEMQRARDKLEQVVKSYPDLVEAHAWLGWTWVHDPVGTRHFAAWEKTLPAAANEHPMIWLVRGLEAERVGQREAAARCFWESLNRDPNYELAAYQLARELSALGREEDAAMLRRRTESLYELADLLKRVHRVRNQLATLPEGASLLRGVAERMEKLGRLREAWAWYLLISKIDPRESFATAAVERLEGKLASGPSLSLVEAEPTLQIDFSSYPLPVWPQDKPTDVAVNRSSATVVRFVDSAPAAGIDFTYFNGDPPGDARLLGTTGGGVAVLDYDGDGWPDIYFTQGSTWPVDKRSTLYRDRLFRNLGNGKFEDVTEKAGLGDTEYSQGISAGDIDNDGFPDLYLANIGANRLFHNNGDGTFTDISARAGISQQVWTTSCLISDLNGDGWPDLFDVNYLEEEALTRRCGEGPCPPHIFPAQDDCLLLGDGSGKFQDTTQAAGITGSRGKGLGIVAADFAATGRLSLFVANDGTPNFFYESVTPPGETVPRFAENGVLSGLAFDRVGTYQACMGVAADDATGGGFIDLFVTNFFNESNTLYVPETPGKFYRDLTAEFGLHKVGQSTLGFGTQFIDGELDGWPDLILTNGHVQDLTKKGTPFQMRAQYYRNVQGTSFEELSSPSLGPFFDRKSLGRGMARLDWNRDGREEVVISNTSSPAALLKNETTPCGHFLALQLRGVACSRDAIGSICELHIGPRKLTRQLTAGDGFQASNQRQLVFGIGEATRLDKLSIRWPGGKTQTYTNLAIDTQYFAIEGREALVPRVPPSR